MHPSHAKPAPIGLRAEEPQNPSPGSQHWPADCGSLLGGSLESFPTWQRGVRSPRALRVLLLRGVHQAPATLASLSDRRTESTARQETSPCSVRNSPTPRRRATDLPAPQVCGPSSRPPPQVGADATAATRREGRGPGRAQMRSQPVHPTAAGAAAPGPPFQAARRRSSGRGGS